MPVGAPPPQTKLDAWRPKLEEMLANPARLCAGGGRVLAAPGKDGVLREVDKWNGYSIRPLAYWADKGEYPSKPIPRCLDDPLCVDCGRFVLDGEGAPTAPPADPTAVVPPPPPVPAAVSSPGVPVERVGSGVEDAPKGASSALVPVPVPAGVPRRRPTGGRVPGWVRPAGVLLAVGVVVAVLFAGVRTLVSPLEDELPQGDVVVVRVAPIAGE